MVKVEDLVVVGLGCSTSIGLYPAAAAAAVRAGIDGFREHPFVVDRNGDPIVVAPVPDLPEDAAAPSRLASLVDRPSRQALEPLEGLPLNGRSVSVALGLPRPRPGVSPESTRQATDRVLEAIRHITGTGAARVATVEADNAAGLAALGLAMHETRRTGGLCLVGGLDTLLDPETLEWLDADGRLAWEGVCQPFTPGEAAAFCLVSCEDTAVQLGLPPLCRVLKVSASYEHADPEKGEVNTGDALTTVIRAATDPMMAAGLKVDDVICDLNGERDRADEYGFAAIRLAERFQNATALTTPADCWGDVGAASGPLFVILASALMARSQEPRHILLWTMSAAGERAAATIASA